MRGRANARDPATARTAIVALALSATIGLHPAPAGAVPSFAQQTGQACAACHVGAFGPQLTPYGREFKLFGYSNAATRRPPLPIAVTAQASLTRTRLDPSGSDGAGAARTVGALDQVSVFYAGRAPLGAGAFVQATWDGVSRSLRVDNLDVRRAADFDVAGHDVVAALDINDAPGVEDLWNTGGVWGFPYASSPFGASPAATLIDGGLSQQVVGAGAYAMFDATLYVDLAGYAAFDRRVLDRLGEGVDSGADTYPTAIPYWRLALEHAFGRRHTFELGASGLAADVRRLGARGRENDRDIDVATDATYQFTGSTRHYLSAHATWIQESARTEAGVGGPARRDRLQTARADVSYSWRNTWTPSVQTFRTWGTADPGRFDGPYGSPGTRGTIGELAFTPFGKSPSDWWNARLAIQVVTYQRFDGQTRGASRNDALYLNLWLAAAPLHAPALR